MDRSGDHGRAPVERPGEAPAEPPPGAHLAALDGLRGAAVLAVVLFHTWTHAFAGGWVGVDVFFVLSGFLITGLLADEVGRTGGLRLRRFYGRRATRLLPPLAVVLVVSAVYAQLWAPPATAAATRVGILVTALHVANVPQVSLGTMQHAWSLSVEEQFYLLWPLVLVLLARRGRLLRGSLVVLAALVAVRLGMVVRGAPPYAFFKLMRGDQLLAGCVLAIAARRWPARRLPGWAAASGALLGVATLLVIVGIPEHQWDDRVSIAVTPIATVATVLVLLGAAVRPWRPLVRALTVRPLPGLGSVSYGVYLYHFPILIALRDRGVPSGPLMALGVVPAALAGAALSHRFLEAPLRSRARRVVAPAPVIREEMSFQVELQRV